MNPADKPVEKATPQTDSSEPKNAAGAPKLAPPPRRWPLVALVVGLLFLGGQIYLQRDYWGLVLHQGTLFPNWQRANYTGRREAESVRPIQELPIPGSPASLAGTIPSPTPSQDLEGTAGQPESSEPKTKP